MHSWQDLLKDVQRYQEEQHKKHKSVSQHSYLHNLYMFYGISIANYHVLQVKDSEATTLETVQSIQQTTVALQKVFIYC